MNNDYKKKFKLIKNEILKNDPIGLTDGGAPDDEYDTEIGKLINGLSVIGKDEQEYYKLIVKVFSGLGAVNEDNCKMLAKRLLGI